MSTITAADDPAAIPTIAPVLKPESGSSVLVGVVVFEEDVGVVAVELGVGVGTAESTIEVVVTELTVVDIMNKLFVEVATLVSARVKVVTFEPDREDVTDEVPIEIALLVSAVEVVTVKLDSGDVTLESLIGIATLVLAVEVVTVELKVVGVAVKSAAEGVTVELFDCPMYIKNN